MFARTGVPFSIALVGGLIIPFLLICFASDCLLRKRIGPILFWSTAFLTAAGFVISTYSGYAISFYLYDNYLGPHRISGSAPVWQYDLPTEVWGAFVFGLAFLIGGTWLWRTGIKKSVT
jgi:hypothetical protein